MDEGLQGSVDSICCCWERHENGAKSADSICCRLKRLAPPPITIWPSVVQVSHSVSGRAVQLLVMALERKLTICI